MPKLVILLNKFKNLRIEDISRQSPYKSAHAIVTLKSLAAGVQVVAVFDNTCSEIYYGCLIFCTQLIWSWFNECYSCLRECVVLKDYACVFVLFYFFSFKFQFQSILHLKFTWKFDNDLFSYIICVRITIENQTEFSILCHFLTKRWDTFEIGLLSKEIFFSYSIRLEGSICVEEGPLFNIRINHRWIHFITFT